MAHAASLAFTKAISRSRAVRSACACSPVFMRIRYGTDAPSSWPMNETVLSVSLAFIPEWMRKFCGYERRGEYVSVYWERGMDKHVKEWPVGMCAGEPQPGAPHNFALSTPHPIRYDASERGSKKSGDQ